MKTSILTSAAALALAAGTTFTSTAASVGTIGVTYTAAIATNDAAINVAVVSVVYIPSSSNIFLNGGAINIDGLGKVTGLASIRITGGVAGADDNTFYGDFQTTISGKVSSKGGTTTVQLSMKGTGYTATNSNPTLPIVSSNAQSASVSLTFVGSFDNTVASGTVPIPGTLSGTVKSSLFKGKGSGVFTDDTATEDVFTTTLGLDTGMSVQIIQIGNKIYAGTSSSSTCGFEGSGTTSSKGFTLNFKGVGGETGSTLKMKGPTSPMLIDSTIVPNAPSTNITVTGKVYGQTVNVTGAKASLSP
jgi:hypothetical protein